MSVSECGRTGRIAIAPTKTNSVSVDASAKTGLIGTAVAGARGKVSVATDIDAGAFANAFSDTPVKIAFEDAKKLAALPTIQSEVFDESAQAQSFAGMAGGEAKAAAIITTDGEAVANVVQDK